MKREKDGIRWLEETADTAAADEETRAETRRRGARTVVTRVALLAVAAAIVVPTLLFWLPGPPGRQTQAAYLSVALALDVGRHFETVPEAMRRRFLKHSGWTAADVARVDDVIDKEREVTWRGGPRDNIWFRALQEAAGYLRVWDADGAREALLAAG